MLKPNLDPEALRVLALLRQRGPLPRNDIADQLAFSRSKATVIVNALLQLGIVQEIGEGDSSGGRRPRVLDFNPHFGYVIGVDMGATSLEMALGDFRGQVLERHYEPISIRQGPEEIMPLLVERALAMLAAHAIPTKQVLALGVGVPAPIEFSSGLVVHPSNIRPWENYSIPSFLRQTFPDAAILVDNDANVMALGELRYGMGQQHQQFIFVKVGTGIGAGIILNGQIYRGSNGAAGDIGHISIDREGEACYCGNVGCLESIAAGPAIARRALKAAQEGKSPFLQQRLRLNGLLTAEDVAAAADDGDSSANEIIQESGRTLGESLAGIVNFFNPSLIIIGGGVSRISPIFLVSIRRAILKHALPLSTRHLTVDISGMVADVGVYGALALALDHVFSGQ
jgi:glucokinase-like ROK family protein